MKPLVLQTDLWFSFNTSVLIESIVPAFILGNGKIETSMGASYFVKGVPIDFERVKYKFTAVDCAAKWWINRGELFPFLAMPYQDVEGIRER